jgi:predicted nucleotidyltransferase
MLYNAEKPLLPMTNDTVNQVKSFFERDPDVRLAVLFGSYATGRIHSGSDVDIAVAYPEKMSLEDRVAKAQELSAVVNKEIDLIDLREAHGVLLQQILRNRKTLVNRDPELYGRIIVRRIDEEESLMPLYERVLQARRERFLNGPKGN